ncbi:PilW family protein [Thiothrix nivea]|uniref:Type IV pilus assembly protein PilW n=1 Tax=Thiothrix nivea (strain ATCC 35100 / DSM 5205 / JP2) TaxID=870187 RepID=A0A656HAH2_THINJ|nr:PilW family protein [Thiothrix nivea]EIJ33728.1 hypothetical protein Thini_1107 [Thiothrix nivea DSM 5205]
MQYRNKQKGISLIELMIAMVVSLVLVAGVGTVYVSSKRNYQTRDQLSMMDETARVALFTLTRHLEHAGYASAAKFPLEMVGGQFYVYGDPDPVEGSCGTVKPLALAAVKASATRDNFNAFGDSVSVRFVSDNRVFVDAANSKFPGSCRADCNAPPPTTDCPAAEKGADGYCVLSSCPHSQDDKFACRCNAPPPQLESYLAYNAFHVDTDANTRDSQGNAVPVLYVVGTNSNQSKRPLVNGVENIQFMYGMDDDANGSVDRYVNASGVAAGEWQRVVSIKVGILVRSLDSILPAAQAQTYQVLDAAVTFNDRFQRSVYSTVIYLRNTTAS